MSSTTTLRTFHRLVRRPAKWIGVGAAAVVMALLASSCQYLPNDSQSTVGIFMIGEDSQAVIDEAKALGVTTVRNSQDVSAPIRAATLAYRSAGLRLVLHAKSGPALASAPLTTDSQIADYKRQLGATLDATEPSLLAVENEENYTGFYTGTATQYLRQLNAAAAVAHARKIPVTDGGITSTMAALATWKDLYDRGLHTEAGDFASRAFPDEAWIRNDLAARPFKRLSRPVAETSRQMALDLIAAFRTAPIDAVNFHWYIDDDRALAQTIEYLRRATGKPVVSTEMGQYTTGQDTTDAAVVSGHLDTAVGSKHLPFLIWFDADGTRAIGLHDPATGRLRRSGGTFTTWLQTHDRLIRP